MSPPAAVLDRYVIDPATQCWRWQGIINPDNGYPRVSYNGTLYYAHRLSYEIHVAPLQQRQQVDHVAARGCRYRDCINPDHLEAVTQRENMRRAGVIDKTHCTAGHELTPENTYVRPNGMRECRACRKRPGYHRKKTA